ncbi:MAG: hypothetical protein SFU83_17285 [Meiothermus sp.]|nr:hypothetical protein [Meiothermus sp.]
MNGEQQPLWQLLLLTCGFAGVGALLKVLVESVRHRLLRRGVRILSSAFWGGMVVILLSEWSDFSPKTLLVLATLLGWLGFEATLSAATRLLEKLLGVGAERARPKDG